MATKSNYGENSNGGREHKNSISNNSSNNESIIKRDDKNGSNIEKTQTSMNEHSDDRITKTSNNLNNKTAQNIVDKFKECENNLFKLQTNTDARKMNRFINTVIESLESCKSELEKCSDEEKNKFLDGNNFKKFIEDVKNIKIDRKNNSQKQKIDNLIKDIIKLKPLSKDEIDKKNFENINHIKGVLDSLKEDIKKEILESLRLDINELKEHNSKSDKSIKYLEQKIDKIPKDKPNLNLNPISEKIDKLENSLYQIDKSYDQKSRNIIVKIDSIKFPKLPTDYLKKDDFEFELKHKFDDFKELKELVETVEMIPGIIKDMRDKIEELSKNLGNISSQNSSNDMVSYIPEEEKVVIDLAKYMKDGLLQFENISKEYISKMREIENFEKSKTKHQEERNKSKEDGLKQGKEEEAIKLIKEISEKFPTSFKEIKAIFSDYINEKFTPGEIIEIDSNNQNEFLPFIEGEVEFGKYKVKECAILVNKEVVLKAQIDKIEEENQNDKELSRN